MEGKHKKKMWLHKSIRSFQCENSVLKKISCKLSRHFHNCELIEKHESIRYLNELNNLQVISKREGFLVRKYRNALIGIIRSYRDFEESINKETSFISTQTIHTPSKMVTNNDLLTLNSRHICLDNSNEVVMVCSPMSAHTLNASETSVNNDNTCKVLLNVKLGNVPENLNAHDTSLMSCQSIQIPSEMLTNDNFHTITSQSSSVQQFPESNVNTTINSALKKTVSTSLISTQNISGISKMSTNNNFITMNFQDSSFRGSSSFNSQEENMNYSSDMFGSKNDITNQTMAFLESSQQLNANESNAMITKNVHHHTQNNNLGEAVVFDNDVQRNNVINGDIIFKKPLSKSFVESLPLIIVAENFRELPNIESLTTTENDSVSSCSTLVNTASESQMKMELSASQFIKQSNNMETEQSNNMETADKRKLIDDPGDAVLDPNKNFDDIIAALKYYSEESNSCIRDLIEQIEELAVEQEFKNISEISQHSKASIKTNNDDMDLNKKILDDIYVKFGEMFKNDDEDDDDDSDDEPDPGDYTMLDWRKLKFVN